MKNKVKVLSAVTVSDSVVFFYGMPSFLLDRGFEVAISSTEGSELDFIEKTESSKVYRVKMERDISIIKDFLSLVNVLKIVLDFKPHIINAGTPKAGLLYMLAGWLLRVPVRVYHVRGLRHESLRGFSEKLQIFVERICGRFATHIICETESLKDLALSQRLYAFTKCNVLGPGSSGVELDNYNPDKFSCESRNKLRTKLGIPVDAELIGFLGRVVPRKGISELLGAWEEIRETYSKAYLLIAGPFEDTQPLSEEEYAIIRQDNRIVFLGKVEDVAKYYSIMDIFTLPAHWEGFGNVLVEAASMGVPVITTNGTGTIDAVKDDYNGTVIPVKDVTALTKAISLYLNDSKLRLEHGVNGKEWASRFDRAIILTHLSDFYKKILG